MRAEGGGFGTYVVVVGGASLACGAFAAVLGGAEIDGARPDGGKGLHAVVEPGRMDDIAEGRFEGVVLDREDLRGKDLG